MTTNKLDTMLHNIYADHTEGCDQDDCWSTEIIEAYIAEREIALLENIKSNYMHLNIEEGKLFVIPVSVIDYKLDQLKSNER